MSNFFGEVYGQFGSVWKKLSAGQKVVILLVGFLSAAGIAAVMYWSTRVEMGMLYGGIGPEDAAKIQSKLEEWGVPFEEKGGGTFFVPRGRVYEIRNRLTLEGLPRGDGQGMEIFDDVQLGMTEFLQHVNLTRAKQVELQRTIAWLEQVASARVHITEPRPTVFTEMEKPPTAAVVLRLVPGRSLSTREVTGIANLVAAAVEGLDPGNVKIIDEKGRLLSRPPGGDDDLLATGQMEIKHNFEQALIRKVQERLDTVVGPGKVSVLLNADLDFQKEQRREKKYSNPEEGKIVLSEKTETEDTTKSAPRETGGATGMESKVNGAAPAAAPAEKSTTENVDREYAVNESSLESMAGGFTVKRLSLAVMIDESLKDKETLIEGVVKQAVGFDDQNRNDTCQTAVIPFSTPEAAEEGEDLAQYEKKEFMLDLVKNGVQGLSVAGVVLVLFMMLRRAEKKVKAAAAGSPESTPAIVKEREQAELKRSREEVLTAVQADPVMASEILHEWLQEEEV